MSVVVFASVFSHSSCAESALEPAAQPSSGWAPGLAIGGMTAMVLMFRMLEFENIFSPRVF